MPARAHQPELLADQRQVTITNGAEEQLPSVAWLLAIALEHVQPFILEAVRLFLRPAMLPALLLAFVILAACGGPATESPKGPLPSPASPTTEPWYAQTTNDLAASNVQARQFIRQGKSNEASALIVKGELLSKQLMSVPQPTLAATEAASDLDDLYARMLLSNRNYGWARLLFQKNVARWKNWKPSTPDTAARRKQAEDAIAECDRRML